MMQSTGQLQKENEDLEKQLRAMQRELDRAYRDLSGGL